MAHFKNCVGDCSHLFSLQIPKCSRNQHDVVAFLVSVSGRFQAWTVEGVAIVCLFVVVVVGGAAAAVGIVRSPVQVVVGFGVDSLIKYFE